MSILVISVAVTRAICASLVPLSRCSARRRTLGTRRNDQAVRHKGKGEECHTRRDLLGDVRQLVIVPTADYSRFCVDVKWTMQQ